MPLYDYRCTACGREVEVIHGIYEAGPSECQHCGAPMRKALSSPAIHFKGSGWAKKDAATSARKTAPKTASESADASSGAADGNGKDSSSDNGKSPTSSSKEPASKASSTADSKAD